MPIVQNFSIPAGDDTNLNFDVDPDDGVSLVGSTIYWRVFEQVFGLPVAGSEPVIEKYTDNGLQVTDPDEQTFTVELDREDTIGLLRNYYHEATIKDVDGNYVTVTTGIMTVTGTENRPE